MAPSVEGAGVALNVVERGSGPAVLLVHGIASDAQTLRPVAEALAPQARVIAYDRRGYGDSGTPEGYAKTTVEEHADDLVALIRGLDAAPAVLCGLSFASMACLDAMAREPELVRGAVLIEPPVLWLSPGGAEVMSGMRKAVEDGAASGGSSGALEAFATYVCGPQALDLIGAERMAVANRSPRSFAADLSASWSLPPRELRGIEQPVTVVVGERSGAAWREAATALAEMLPRGELVETGTGHLVPIEAPELLAEAIRGLAAQP